MRFAVEDLPSVERLRSDRALKRTILRIVVKDPTTQGPHRLEVPINRAYFACGCGYGAGAVYVALAFAGTLWWTQSGPIDWNWWKLCLAAFGAGFIGKLVGLVLSRLRLNRLLKELAEEFSKLPTSTASAAV